MWVYKGNGWLALEKHNFWGKINRANNNHLFYYSDANITNKWPILHSDPGVNVTIAFTTVFHKKYLFGAEIFNMKNCVHKTGHNGIPNSDPGLNAFKALFRLQIYFTPKFWHYTNLCMKNHHNGILNSRSNSKKKLSLWLV